MESGSLSPHGTHQQGNHGSPVARRGIVAASRLELKSHHQQPTLAPQQGQGKGETARLQAC